MPDIFVSGEGEKAGKQEVEKKSEKGVEVIAPKELPRGKARHQIYGHSHSPLSAFSYYPDKVKFVETDVEEKIILLLRRHPITNIKWMVVAAIMLLAPLFLSYLPPLGGLSEGYQLVLLMVWYLVTSAFIIEKFLDWYFNVNIITDERVFDVDFVNLIYREITDANIDQIQDVTVQVGGVLRTMVDYGDIVIQTAAEVPRIEFIAVPHPDKVGQILRELRVEEEQEKLEGRVR